MKWQKKSWRECVKSFLAAVVLITIMALCTPLFFQALYQHVVMADNKGTILRGE